jgi:hypothetical protein
MGTISRMKRFILFCLFLCPAFVFADMNPDLFFTAINMKLSIAAYGGLYTGKMDLPIAKIKSEDTDGDGVIYLTDGDKIATNNFYIANANTGNYLILILSNKSDFLDAFSAEDRKQWKLYTLLSQSGKNKIMKDFNILKNKLLGSK